MKRISAIILTLLYLLLPTCAIADTDISYCVMHTATGQIVKQENGDKRRDVAGLSRLPALVTISKAIEAAELDPGKEITVSNEAAKIAGATAFIKPAERIKADLLLKSAAIINAGDATYALGEGLCGSHTDFCKRVNKELSDLGINSQYNGGSSPLELTAKEIAILGTELAKYKCFTKYSSVYMDSIVHESGVETELVNQNRLVRTLSGCTGLSTGSSGSKNYCGVFITSRRGCSYITVVLGARNSDERFKLATELTEAAFSTYKETTIAQKNDVLIFDQRLEGAMTKLCNVVAAHDAVILTENRSVTPKCSFNIPDALSAPIKAGETIGNAVYTDEKGNVLCTVELTVKENIEKADFFDFFKYIAEIW